MAFTLPGMDLMLCIEGWLTICHMQAREALPLSGRQKKWLRCPACASGSAPGKSFPAHAACRGRAECSCRVCWVRDIEADAKLVAEGQRRPTAVLTGELLDILAQKLEREAMGRQRRWEGRYCKAPGCNRPIQQARLGRKRLFCPGGRCAARYYRAQKRQVDGAMAERSVVQAIDTLGSTPQWPK
jgi:hypothetical protein